MTDTLYDEWRRWVRANPDTRPLCACSCHDDDRELQADLAQLTPEMTERATREVFGDTK